MFIPSLITLAAKVSADTYTPHPWAGIHDVWPSKPSDLSTPLGIRLGLASPNSINVGWSTFEEPTEVCVSYGLTTDVNETACGGSPSIYETSRLWFSSVELTGLEPNKQYFYKIHSTNSTTYNFTSGLSPGDKSKFSFAVAADMGLHGVDGYQIQSNQIDSYTNNVSTWDDVHISAERLSMMADTDNVHLVLHAGDFAYADNTVDNINDLAAGGLAAYEALLEQFYTQLSQISKKVPYMVLPGNHEAACEEESFSNEVCPKGQNNFTDFRYRHGGVMPSGFNSTSTNDTARALRDKANNLSYAPMWYSFDYGSVHFVMINTETDFDNAPDQVGSKSGQGYGLYEGPFGRYGQQVEWLEADLASVDRSVTPWVILSGHRPWYTSAPDQSGCLTCQNAFEDVIYKYNVDLAFFGHVHNSQRYLPMYRGVPDTLNAYNNSRSPTYIVAGASGNIEGFAPVSHNASDNIGLGWYSDKYYTVVRVDVKTEEDLQITFVRSSDGKELDSVSLHRKH